MAKQRQTIPPDVAADVMFASDATCCVCRNPGKRVQIHHIDEDPANSLPANLAVLCLTCHDQTQVSGGFGRRLGLGLVTRYRDEWLARVAQRRDLADQLAAQQTVRHVEGEPLPPTSKAFANEIKRTEPWDWDSIADAAMNYVEGLTKFRMELLKEIGGGADGNDSVTTIDLRLKYSDTLQAVMVKLASFFPSETFGEDPHRFFAEQIAARWTLHSARVCPPGSGVGGSYYGMVCSRAICCDAELMVEDLASSLIAEDMFDWEGWQARWHEPGA